VNQRSEAFKLQNRALSVALRLRDHATSGPEELATELREIAACVRVLADDAEALADELVTAERAQAAAE
jgi:hypothetical protein